MVVVHRMDPWFQKQRNICICAERICWYQKFVGQVSLSDGWYEKFRIVGVCVYCSTALCNQGRTVCESNVEETCVQGLLFTYIQNS